MDSLRQKTQKNFNYLNHRITLIEIILMIMLLAIFASIFISSYWGWQEFTTWRKRDTPEVIKEKKDILTIKNAMTLYKIDNGFYPTNAQGISALIIKPTIIPIPQYWVRYLKVIPIDPWGRPYQYANPGKHEEIEIFSYGPKGAPDQKFNLPKIPNIHP